MCDIKSCQLGTAREHSGHRCGSTGVQVLQTVNHAKLTEVLEPVRQVLRLHVAEALVEDDTPAIAKHIRGSPRLVRYVSSAPRCSDEWLCWVGFVCRGCIFTNILVIIASGCIARLALREIEGLVVHTPDGVGHRLVQIVCEEAMSTLYIRTGVFEWIQAFLWLVIWIFNITYSSCLINIVIACSITTFEIAASVEHVGVKEFRTVNIPVVVAIDGSQSLTIIEHLVKLRDLADIETVQVKTGQFHAVFEHICHRDHVARVEMAHIEGVQVRAVTKHMSHVCYLFSVEMAEVKFGQLHTNAKHA